MAAPVPAAEPAVPADPYTVSGVVVDVTAASAAEARDKAILEGQRKAFVVLFKRLTGDGGRIPPEVGESELQRMIQGFEIQHEQGSAVRYVGTLSFKFRRSAARAYLSSLGVRVSEPAAASPPPAGSAQAVAATPAAAPAAGPGSAGPAAPLKPTLVLPVFQGGGRSLLWEERTPWQSAWEDFAAAASAARVTVPPGELEDISAIGVNEALKGDAGAIAKIAAHYNAGDVVVATLAAGATLDPAVGGQVVITRFDAMGQPTGAAETLQVKGAGGEALPAFLGRAVTAAVDRMASLPHAAVPPPASAENRIQVGITVSGLPDWLEIHRRLASNPMVTGVDTLSLSTARVEVGIHYRGDRDALQAMLERDALTLVQVPEAPGWALFLKASAQTAPNPQPAPAPAAPTSVVPPTPGPAPGPSAGGGTDYQPPAVQPSGQPPRTGGLPGGAER